MKVYDCATSFLYLAIFLLAAASNNNNYYFNRGSKSRDFKNYKRASSYRDHESGRLLLITIVELLWTAPEILRNDELQAGSHKADVYSFAIIMQEVIVRSYPFEMLDRSYDGLFNVHFTLLLLCAFSVNLFSFSITNKRIVWRQDTKVSRIFMLMCSIYDCILKVFRKISGSLERPSLSRFLCYFRH